MNEPWSAEQEVKEPLARALIEAQFPQLAPARLKLLGAGWDNTAFLVNDLWVFRFPRRQIAVALLETERRLLPQIAARLPLPVPFPEFHGQADEPYTWPFAGYRLLPGCPVPAAALNESQRIAAAEPIARFLRALHSLPAEEMARLGAGPDTLGRLEIRRRAARARQRLDGLSAIRSTGLRPGTPPPAENTRGRTPALRNARNLVKEIKPLVELLNTAEEPRLSRPPTLVHGDFYAAHLLVDANRRPCGVIDWGDVHLGHPAVDLALVFGFLPPQGRELFQSIYGDLDEEMAQLARFKALEVALMLESYAQDTAKADLLREGQVALRYVVED